MGALNKLLIFAAGAGIGSVVTLRLVKSKYEEIAKSEIDSIREMYKERMNGEPDEKDGTSNTEKTNDMTEYKSLLNQEGYTSYSAKTKEDEKEEEEDVDKPYVISPDDFDTLEYEVISLIYYADEILADERGNIIEDVESMIGVDSLTHFGEYEDDSDSVFVRDDAKGIDYEITLDTDKYGDVYGVDD